MDTIKNQEEQTILTPIIDKDKCCGDGLCIKACVRHCLSMDSDKKARYRPMFGECFQCGHCLAICPTKAISFENVNIEELESGKSNVTPEDLSHLIRMRRTIRSFKDEAIPEESLLKALDTARFAPTGKHVQDVSWVLVSNKEVIQEVALLTAQTLVDLNPDDKHSQGLLKGFKKGRNLITYNAQQMIIAHTPKTSMHLVQNSTIATSYLELLLSAMGIGTCWAGYLTRASASSTKIKEMLKIPSDHEVAASLLIGYPELKYRRSVMRKKLDLQIIS